MVPWVGVGSHLDEYFQSSRVLFFLFGNAILIIAFVQLMYYNPTKMGSTFK